MKTMKLWSVFLLCLLGGIIVLAIKFIAPLYKESKEIQTELERVEQEVARQNELIYKKRKRLQQMESDNPIVIERFAREDQKKSETRETIYVYPEGDPKLPPTSPSPKKPSANE